MSKSQLETAKECSDYIHERVTFLSKALSIINPINEEDKITLKIGIDLMKTIDEKLQDAETAAEYSRVFDNLEELDEQWPSIKATLESRGIGDYATSAAFDPSVLERKSRYEKRRR